MENMDEVREWVKSRTAVSAASIQRKFRVTYPAAARAIDVLQEEARITEDWDASEGGYVVLGRQSNNGLQADVATDSHCPECNSRLTWCAECEKHITPSH